MSIDFQQLQAIYREQMDQLLAINGLTMKCFFNYDSSRGKLCPNCFYDNSLKKSSGRYKPGGPRAFLLGRICPYCNGFGYTANSDSEEVYLAVIANHKDWVVKPTNQENPQNMIQTICSKDFYAKIKKCRDLTVVYSEVNSNPTYSLVQDPTFVGLGNGDYIVANWQITGNGVA